MSNKYIESSNVAHDGTDENDNRTYNVYLSVKGLPSHKAAHAFVGAVERLLLADENPKAADEWPAPTGTDTASLVADYEARIEALTADKDRAQRTADTLRRELENAEGQAAQYEALMTQQRVLLSEKETTIQVLRGEAEGLAQTIKTLGEELAAARGLIPPVGDDEAPDTRDLRIEELEKELTAAKADAEASRMALDRIRNAKHLETQKPPAPKPAVIETQEPVEEVDLGAPLPSPTPSREFDGFLSSLGESVARRTDIRSIAWLWASNDDQIDKLDTPALNRAKRLVIDRLKVLNESWTDAEARLAFGKALTAIVNGKKGEAHDLTPASPVARPAVPPPPVEETVEPAPEAPAEASNGAVIEGDLLAQMQAATRLSEVIKLAVDAPAFHKDAGTIITALLSVKDKVKMLSNPNIETRLQRSVAVAIAAETT